MNAPDLDWGTIHPSAFGHAAALVLPAETTTRPHGAQRYQCPVTGSFVLLTDEASLEKLGTRRTRMRCNACGEIHLLKRREADAAARIGRDRG